MILKNSVKTQDDVIIGVLLSRNTILSIHKGIVNNRVDLLRKANEKAKTILYFFSIQDVNTANLTIYGTYYDNINKSWTAKTFPFPMAFYNRGDVSASQIGKYNLFKRELIKRGVKSINYVKGFNKWEVYCKLVNLTAIRPYLPHTQLYSGTKDLVYMLDKYSKLYLKACRGRKGYHVMRVVRLKSGMFELSCFTRKDKAITFIVNFQKLLKGIRMFFRSRNFIIQEAIDLPVFDNKLADLRAEVQRNGLGNIEITSICVRLSQINSPVTTHGESYILEDFLDKYKNYKPDQIIFMRKKIEDFLYLICTGIESIYGTTGEMGIDFALDKTNRIWFIECNSCPTKVSLLNAYDEDTIEKAFLNPLEYAKYIVSKDK